jgi:hypothetical protein
MHRTSRHRRRERDPPRSNEKRILVYLFHGVTFRRTLPATQATPARALHIFG